MSKEEVNTLSKSYFYLLEENANSFSSVNLSLIKKDVCRTDVLILRKLWERHLYVQNNSHSSQHNQNNQEVSTTAFNLTSSLNSINTENPISDRFKDDNNCLKKSISMDTLENNTFSMDTQENNSIAAECCQIRLQKDQIIDKKEQDIDLCKNNNLQSLTAYQEKMCQILSLYSVYTKTEYVQGMSDILSPIFASVDFDEVVSFWIFYYLMNGVSFTKGSLIEPESLLCLQQNNSCFTLHSFYAAIDSLDMKEALWTIGQLLRMLNRDLYFHLQEHGLESLLVCYRWLLVWFKREFSFEDICRLWEVC